MRSLMLPITSQCSGVAAPFPWAGLAALSTAERIAVVEPATIVGVAEVRAAHFCASCPRAVCAKTTPPNTSQHFTIVNNLRFIGYCRTCLV